MELYTESLILRTVDDSDINEVARMWDWQNGAVSAEQAKEAVLWMQENHKKNKPGELHHLCLAVYEKGSNRMIGWCGLDGQWSPGKTVLFYSIHSDYQNKGYATQCAGRLLSYAFCDLGLSSVSGGCDKHNLASFRVMEKIGMEQNAFEDNGDPLFFIDQETYEKMIK
ncbi:MAG: GNAT family N-acetyltransferase [Massiliimalia sp.]